MLHGVLLLSYYVSHLKSYFRSHSPNVNIQTDEMEDSDHNDLTSSRCMTSNERFNRAIDQTTITAELLSYYPLPEFEENLNIIKKINEFLRQGFPEHVKRCILNSNDCGESQPVSIAENVQGASCNTFVGTYNIDSSNLMPEINDSELRDSNIAPSDNVANAAPLVFNSQQADGANHIPIDHQSPAKTLFDMDNQSLIFHTPIKGPGRPKKSRKLEKFTGSPTTPYHKRHKS